MPEMSAAEWIEQLNRYGSQGQPCLFVLDYSLREPVVLPLDQAPAQAIYYCIPSQRNLPDRPLNRTYRFHARPLAPEHYREAFEQVYQEFQAGNTYILNLSFPTPLETDLSLQEIFQASRAPYRLWFKDRFVVFSPESFVRMQSDTISAFPMKGTRRVDNPQAEQELLEDTKELAEHTAIVDLLRNDLSRVARRVSVPRFRYTEHIPGPQGGLIQTSSHIQGELDQDWRSRMGSILAELLPAGSISGAPKYSTCRIISRVEGYERGYFSGVFGIFDGQALDSAVMIRYIERQGSGLVFKSGGGVMIYSDWEQEYREMVDKVYVPIT